MTVRASQIQLDTDSTDTELETGIRQFFTRDLLVESRHSSFTKFIVVSAVREIMRNEQCDMIPKVLGVTSCSVWGRTDQWGNKYFIEVQYAKNGWRAVYAAPGRHGPWVCYMN